MPASCICLEIQAQGTSECRLAAQGETGEEAVRLHNGTVSFIHMGEEFSWALNPAHRPGFGAFWFRRKSNTVYLEQKTRAKNDTLQKGSLANQL